MSVTTIPLSALPTGARARVVGLDECLGRAVCRRLADLGFVADTPVECLRRAPMGSPVVYCVGETELCLRGDLAGCVLVEQSA
ncbi:MAG TPA: FeoA family protein [Actinotalea sp.]|nr:FeoA family protein [Actinotalea sp.]